MPAEHAFLPRQPKPKVMALLLCILPSPTPPRVERPASSRLATDPVDRQASVIQCMGQCSARVWGWFTLGRIICATAGVGAEVVVGRKVGDWPDDGALGGKARGLR